MSRQPESAIVNAILHALNDLPHTYARKVHGSRYCANFPDIVVCHRGRTALIEVKQPGKDATPRQAHELRKWELAGAIVGVVHDVEEALEAITSGHDGGASGFACCDACDALEATRGELP
jgi:hypothetical protein